MQHGRRVGIQVTADFGIGTWHCAGQESLQHDTQGVDVGGGGYRAPARLLGGRVGRCACTPAVVPSSRSRVVEQPGDAEVQQLDLAIEVDEQVVGLEVAVYDQLAVCMRDGGTDLQHQPQTLPTIQLLPGRVVDEVGALHPLHHKIRPAAIGDSGVVEPGDVRMLQQGPDLALLGHALGQSRTARQMRQLQRHLPLENAVDSFGEPDRAHATAADLSYQTVWAQTVAGCRGGHVIRYPGQRRYQAGGNGFGSMPRQHLPQRLQQRLLRRRQRTHPGLALARGQVERSIQQSAQFADLLGGQTHVGAVRQVGGGHCLQTSTQSCRQTGHGECEEITRRAGGTVPLAQRATDSLSQSTNRPNLTCVFPGRRCPSEGITSTVLS